MKREHRETLHLGNFLQHLVHIVDECTSQHEDDDFVLPVCVQKAREMIELLFHIDHHVTISEAATAVRWLIAHGTQRQYVDGVADFLAAEVDST